MDKKFQFSICFVIEACPWTTSSHETTKTQTDLTIPVVEDHPVLSKLDSLQLPEENKHHASQTNTWNKNK